MKAKLIKILLLVSIFLGTLSQAQELVIPKNFKYQTINNSGEFSETIYKDGNLSRFYRYREYTIKLYSDYNVTADDQAPHVGVMVKLDNKNATLFQIQDTYVGHNVKVVVYDRSNQIIGLSESKEISGNEILNTNLAITTFENKGYRFVYDERDGRLELDKADTKEIECYIGNTSNIKMSKFCKIRDEDDDIYNRVGQTSTYRENLNVPSGDYFVTIVTLKGEEIKFPIFHLAPKRPLLRKRPFVPHYVTTDSIVVSVQGEAGTTVVVNGVDKGIISSSKELNVTIDTSGARGGRVLLFSLKDSIGKTSANNRRWYQKITDVKSFVLTTTSTMKVGESISISNMSSSRGSLTFRDYGFEYKMLGKVIYNDNVEETFEVRSLNLDFNDTSILERRVEARSSTKAPARKATYLYALKEGTVMIKAKIGDIDSNQLTIKVKGNPDKGIYYKKFAVTRLNYRRNSDWNSIVKDVAGENYQVADWNDLKEFYTHDGNLSELFNHLGLLKLYDSVFLQKDGLSKNSDGYYFASRREHNKYNNENFENLDNDFIILRTTNSYIYKPVLMVRKVIDTDGDGIPDSEDSDDDNDGISEIDEIKYGFDPLNKNDATQDADGDGVSNIDEIKAGTNPKDKNDYPKGMTRQEKTLFLILQNRSIVLTKKSNVKDESPLINIPTILMLEAMKSEK